MGAFKAGMNLYFVLEEKKANDNSWVEKFETLASDPVFKNNEMLADLLNSKSRVHGIDVLEVHDVYFDHDEASVYIVSRIEFELIQDATDDISEEDEDEASLEIKKKFALAYRSQDVDYNFILDFNESSLCIEQYLN